jgi:hypothetical protein
MDGRQSKRRKGSKGPRKPSQSRASIEEVEDPIQAVPLERTHRSKKLIRHQDAHSPVASPSPEAEGSRAASSSRSPTETTTGKRNYGKDHATPLRKHSKKRKASAEAATMSSKELSLADETEVDRAVSLQANDAALLQSTSRAHIEALEQENARLQKELASKDGALEKQRQTISYVYGQCTCTVCMELAWRPHVLSPCGHVFCARCLVAWFTKPTSTESTLPAEHPNRQEIERTRTLNRVKACPQCREKVTVAPIEVWVVKGLVDHIDKSMRDGQGNDDHLVQGHESLAGLSVPELKEAKGGNLPASPAIWKDIFSLQSQAVGPMYDEEDRVFRCTMCASEVVNGQCTNPGCQTLYDILDFGDDSDSMLDDDYSVGSEDFPEDDDLAFIDDEGIDGPIVIDDNSDDSEDGQHSEHGDSVIFASGSEQGAIVISSESSDDDEDYDEDSVHEVQQAEDEEDIGEEVRSDDEDDLQEVDEDEALQYDEDEVQEVEDDEDGLQYDDEDDVQLVDEYKEDQEIELSASEAGATDSDY